MAMWRAGVIGCDGYLIHPVDEFRLLQQQYSQLVGLLCCCGVVERMWMIFQNGEKFAQWSLVPHWFYYSTVSRSSSMTSPAFLLSWFFFSCSLALMRHPQQMALLTIEHLATPIEGSALPPEMWFVCGGCAFKYSTELWNYLPISDVSFCMFITIQRFRWSNASQKTTLVNKIPFLNEDFIHWDDFFQQPIP